MASIIDKLKKRKCYTITIDGEAVKLRSLTFGELSRLEGLPSNEKPGFMLGCALLEDDSTRAFSIADGETDAQFSKRVSDSIPDVPTDTLRAICDAVGKLAQNIPPQDTLVKNS